MKHVIYSTEFYSGNGTFLREEENDAYFNTIPEDLPVPKKKRRSFALIAIRETVIE